MKRRRLAQFGLLGLLALGGLLLVAVAVGRALIVALFASPKGNVDIGDAAVGDAEVDLLAGGSRRGSDPASAWAPWSR